MRVTILSIGHRMPSWIQEGFNEYARRMPPEIRVELVELKPEERGAGKNAEKAKSIEGERLLAALPEGGTLIALDEHGRSVATRGLSVMLSGWMRDASRPVFAIGGAGGLSEAGTDRARQPGSFSTPAPP